MNFGSRFYTINSFIATRLESHIKYRLALICIAHPPGIRPFFRSRDESGGPFAPGAYSLEGEIKHVC